MAIVALNCREVLEQPINRKSRDPEKAQQAAAVNCQTREQKGMHLDFERN